MVSVFLDELFVKHFVSPNFWPVLSDKVAWKMVCGFGHDFCRLIFTPAYYILNMTALTNLANSFVGAVLVCVVRISLLFFSSWFDACVLKSVFFLLWWMCRHDHV